MGWEFVKLGDLVHRKIGYGIVQPGANVDVGVPVIKVNNIISGLSNIELLEKTTTDIDARYTRTRLVGGELVISLVGSVGKTAIVPKTFAGCNLVRATGLIDIKDEILAKWVKYYIDSPLGQAYINSNVNTTVQVTLNIKSLVDMPIPLPDHAILEKIVAILSSLDDKIELNRRINANLEQQAQAFYKSWFVNFEPFGGKMPEDWRVGTLGDIIETIESGSRPKGGSETSGVPSIGAEKIERFGHYEYSGEKFINRDYFHKMKRGHVKNGDVLLYKDGAYTGKTSMVLDGFPYRECAVNEHVFILRTVTSKYQFFLYCLMSYPDIRKMVYTLASAKAAQPGLNQTELLGVNIVVPSYNMIKKFNHFITPHMHQIAINALESSRLAQLRDTLLPKLMSGEIKV